MHHSLENLENLINLGIAREQWAPLHHHFRKDATD